MEERNISMRKMGELLAQENPAFPFEYYNVEIHRGALAVPEFMKRDLGNA